MAQGGLVGSGRTRDSAVAAGRVYYHVVLTVARGKPVFLHDEADATFLIEEWTGGSWQTVHTPIPPGATGYLDGVAVTPEGDIWVVGAAGLTIMVHTGPVTRVGLACPPT